MRIRVLALALLAAPLPLSAQAPMQPIGMSDADALAEQVRRLGANPLDLEALLTAGELSIRLDDMSAAGAFFARAEKLDPRSGRAKAGEGAILAHSERPAESLRYFAQAEALGLAPARLGAERGLAYDLLGDPGRAQRDYRAALALRDDAEVRRRYALSLGIAGRQAQALDALAPLIRQNDRAAWRSRAFVLAMGGNATEATRIAETMMPPGAAAGLQAFFLRLPRMAAADRAFAVHFGEVEPTPQRLADARFAPREAPLALEPLPVQVAAAPLAETRRGKRDRKRRETAVAVVIPAPAPALPEPPRYEAAPYSPPAAATPVRDRPLTAGEQATLAAAGYRAPTRQTSRGERVLTMPVVTRALTPGEQASLAAAGARDAARSAPPTRVAVLPAPVRPMPVPPVVVAPPTRVAAVVPELVRQMPAPTIAPPPPARVAVIAPTVQPPPVLAPTILPPPVSAPVEPAAPSIAAEPSPTPGFSSALTAPPVAVAPPAVASIEPTPPAPAPVAPSAAPSSTPLAPLVTPPAAVASPRLPGRRVGRGAADSILAKIVAGIAIPASELDVAPPVRPTPGRTSADRVAADRKAAADKKALAERKAAADKKAQADREAAEERRIARSEPPRIWVQVAGGALEAGLPLAWRTMQGRAPQVLTGRQAWTTPLRATNRVLTGPFKTEAEARAVVNQLAKQGVQAFTFTSDAGQKITRLATK